MILVAVVLEAATLLLAQTYRIAAIEVRTVQELVAHMYALSAAEWEAIATLQAGEADLDELTEGRREVDSLADDLAADGIIDETTHVLIDGYLAAIEVELRLLSEGRIDGAIDVDESTVDPLFDSLVVTLEETLQKARSRADAANLLATAGLLMAVAAGVGFATALVGRLERARMNEEAVLAKDQFLATVSHELRTPLTSVRGFAEVLDEEQLVDPDERAELIAMIVDQAREMSDLIEDLLIGARHEIGTLAIKPEHVDVGAAVQSTLSAIAIPANRSLTTDVADDVAVVADPGRLRQILRNLITNALRYGGEHISVGARRTPRGVSIEVADNGPGVPESRRNVIFAAYTQATPGGPTGSVGIGLYVCRQLAELMNGSISYRREAGSTVFCLELPEGADAPRALRASRPLAESTPAV